MGYCSENIIENGLRLDLCIIDLVRKLRLYLVFNVFVFRKIYFLLGFDF